jgi:ABC-type dipeptide/oligopeptide/nickel transport system permease subunit
VVPALLALAFVFGLAFLAPEGMRNAMLGAHSWDPAAVARVDSDEHLGWVAPLRFGAFVVGVVHGDFGRSYVQDVDVERELARHALVTVALVAAAVVLTRNRFGPAVVFAVLAFEAAAGLPGVGRTLAVAIDVRDVVMTRAALAVALLGCVALPRARAGASAVARSLSRSWEVAGWAWLFVVAVTIAFAQRLPFADPDALSQRHAWPSWSHWLGTDDSGHDVLARLVWGAQGTLTIALAAAVVGCVLGIVGGALAAEAPGVRRVSAWIGCAGVPAVGLSVGLASMLGREPFVIWQWLVPVTIGPALGWATLALDGSPVDGAVLSGGLAALGVGLGNAIAGEAVLGALGCFSAGTLTLGAMLDDVRLSDHRSWLVLAVVGTFVVVTVAALGAAAASLRAHSRRLVPARAGTMVVS